MGGRTGGLIEERPKSWLRAALLMGIDQLAGAGEGPEAIETAAAHGDGHRQMPSWGKQHGRIVEKCDRIGQMLKVVGGDQVSERSLRLRCLR